MLLNKEKRTLPRTSADVSQLDCVTAWGQADTASREASDADKTNLRVRGQEY